MMPLLNASPPNYLRKAETLPSKIIPTFAEDGKAANSWMKTKLTANVAYPKYFYTQFESKINSQSLEDTQVGYISQKYTLDKHTLEKFT